MFVCRKCKRNGEGKKNLIASLVGDNRINSQKHYVTFVETKQEDILYLVFCASNWFAIFLNSIQNKRRKMLTMATA